jgi:hypothetical protein
LADKHGLISASILNGFISELKERKPLDYHLLNRLRLMPRFVDQPISYPNFRTANYPVNLVYVFLDSALFYFASALFLLGVICFLVMRKPGDIWYWLLCFVPIFILLFFTALLRINELRFFALSVPFIICCGALGLSRLLSFKPRIGILGLLAALVFTAAMTYKSLMININW